VVPPCKTNLTSYLRSLDVPGLAAGIVKDGELVCASGAGMADIEKEIEVTPQTLFLVASVSKTVTATALLQLHEQGKFQLDDDVNRYLPFKVKIPAAPNVPVTVRQLLTHTSSIKDNGAYINCPDTCDYGSDLIRFVTQGADSPIALKDFTRGYLEENGIYYDKKKNFEAGAPGTINEYSNMGTVLAGYLIEVISESRFDEYCRTHIFDPLNMHRTSWRLAKLDPSHIAIPYDKRKSRFIPYGHFGEPDYPDGMLRTSVVELANFLSAYMRQGAFQGRRILEPWTIAKMLTAQTRLNDSQGLAWYQQWIQDRAVWGHDGSDNGACAGMWFDPIKGVGVVVMANGVCRHRKKLYAELFRESDEY
jgi:CubicO group peptidase (beta-lactamase class C family)